MTTIYLVRHGTTEWVDTRLLHGITDIPLNERGKRQARAAAGAFAGIKIDHIYTSPLSRCFQTAGFVSSVVGIEPTRLDNLKELDFGWLEGSRNRVYRSGKYGKIIEECDRFGRRVIRAISGEPLKLFQKRILTAWQQVLDENPNGTTVIVGHSGVFNAILIHFFGKNFPPGERYYYMNPASISRVDISSDGKVELTQLNDTSHLPDDIL